MGGLPPALNQTVCALRFFYGVTLDRAEIPERIAYALTPRKLSVIGGLVVQDGRVSLGNGPGLGVEIDDELLRTLVIG